ALMSDSGEAEAQGLNVIALEDALARLESLDERSARVVELRYYAGLDVVETARVLDISPASVKRDWSLARAFLKRELL
ncbi:MAG: RNA polymerase subunit sigma-70, partial [Gemmatimonadales bacterium]|nr:RNA polymerase subunit sigma-70 [Gemmatimonadales bacterium]